MILYANGCCEVYPALVEAELIPDAKEYVDSTGLAEKCAQLVRQGALRERERERERQCSRGEGSLLQRWQKKKKKEKGYDALQPGEEEEEEEEERTKKQMSWVRACCK